MDKTCRKCGETKTVIDFYKGYASCKACVVAMVRNRRRTNPAVQEYDRQRAKTPKRKAHAARVSRKWREDHPRGYKAQSAVSNAIRDGKLTKKPCLFCGNPKVHAHHRDYSKPLDVTWLCAKCHHRLHATFPETEGREKAA
jgi:ribosomal protein S27AE